MSGGLRNFQNERYSEAGMSTDGEVILTFKTGVSISNGDRVDLVNSTISINNERLVRGSTRGILNLTNEVLRITPILEIEFCEAKINNQIVRYIRNTHFQVDPQTGKVTWSANVIPNGTVYTMRYRTYMSYVCWSPTTREEGGKAMPYRCAGHRLDFISRPMVES